MFSVSSGMAYLIITRSQLPCKSVYSMYHFHLHPSYFFLSFANWKKNILTQKQVAGGCRRNKNNNGYSGQQPMSIFLCKFEMKIGEKFLWDAFCPAGVRLCLADLIWMLPREPFRLHLFALSWDSVFHFWWVAWSFLETLCVIHHIIHIDVKWAVIILNGKGYC